MCLPEYWLYRLPMQLNEAITAACDALLQRAVKHGPATPMLYSLDVSKWQFLCYKVERHRLVLHGSANRDIMTFEPRQPIDLGEFGAQNAVYAAADGILPIYFAIIDRAKSPTIINGCIYPELADGTIGEARYVF
jgi:hypothetical protein